ncbi:hypothetical protein, partial [Stenotrophomonas maltophilia]|uniref:hypothetical protein n=1 Tax=Stenotrophomonas maltophilia TaxID=40324 RepID=UPI001C12FB08
MSTKVDTYQQPPESVGGGAVWLGRTVGAMDGAIEPYLMEICQRRCREPAWAAVRAWISTIAMELGAHTGFSLDPPEQ